MPEKVDETGKVNFCSSCSAGSGQAGRGGTGPGRAPRPAVIQPASTPISQQQQAGRQERSVWIAGRRLHCWRELLLSGPAPQGRQFRALHFLCVASTAETFLPPLHGVDACQGTARARARDHQVEMHALRDGAGIIQGPASGV